MTLGTAGERVWWSSFGRLVFDAAGDAWRGRYEHRGGTLEGRLEGEVLRGTWSEPSQGKSGPFEMRFDATGNGFRGHWKYDGDAGWRGPWDGVLCDTPVEGDGRSLGSWNGQPGGPLLAGPMLGEVGTNDARVWVQARDGAELRLRVTAPDGREQVLSAWPARAEWLCGTFTVAGLEPDTSYAYVLESAHGTTPQAHFRTAPLPTARKARIAFGSCYDVHDRPLPIFESIAQESPDLFLFIGDNCYYLEPDWQSEHTMMLAQLRNRCNPTLGPLLARVPSLAIWDDHDFGPNDSDGRYPDKDRSLCVFERVWAQRSYGLPDATGVFSSVRFGPVEMFLLDGRYERLARQQILGARQLDWLEERLRASSAPVKLVVSGSQLLPLAAVEKDWECFRRDAPGELERLLRFVCDEDIRGVVYVSGDVHLGYLLHEPGRARPDGQVGPETWELTASPLSNEPWHEVILAPGQPHDPYILRELAVQNYGVVDVDLDRTGHEIHFVLKDPAGRTLIDQPIALGELGPGRPGERQAPARPGGGPLGAGVGAGAGAALGAAAPRSAERITAVLCFGRTAEFVRGDTCLAYDLDARAPLGAPASVQSVFPGTTVRGIEAAAAWPNGKAYFFTGSRYYRFDLARRAVDPGYPLDIAPHWPGVFPERIDAAVAWPNGKAFFFRGSEYLRYDIAADRVDPGYPLPIAPHWPGVWAEGIDAALGPLDGKVWFFRGDEVVRYDIAADRADPGYPRPIDDEWPGAGRRSQSSS
ncbi:MAG: alkaline phosphatase D family protein [Polyangiaceae bacterium]|nr:alkaline phosphatase D family protein [Polyangiaceae bacterium]